MTVRIFLAFSTRIFFHCPPPVHPPLPCPDLANPTSPRPVESTAAFSVSRAACFSPRTGRASRAPSDRKRGFKKHSRLLLPLCAFAKKRLFQVAGDQQDFACELPVNRALLVIKFVEPFFSGGWRFFTVIGCHKPDFFVSVFTKESKRSFLRPRIR